MDDIVTETQEHFIVNSLCGESLQLYNEAGKLNHFPWK